MNYNTDTKKSIVFDDNSSETVIEYVSDDEYTNEDFMEEFSEKKASIKNRVRRFLFGKKYLGFCFLVPFVLMALIYVAIGVWPVGEKSALVLDLNAQYVYYIEKFRSIFTEGGSFLYTFERAVGGEFMGIFAYYLASPFNLLTVLFPREWMTEVVLAILLFKCGFCGLTFGMYIHSRFEIRRPMATIIFSSMYALTSFAVVMQNNLMWTDCIILFPIILLGMDRLIKYGKYKTYTISLALAIFTNFYIGYMLCLFLLIYFFVRYFTMDRTERNPRGVRFQFLRALPKMFVFSVIAVMIAAVVIFCAYYALTFGKLEFSEPNYEPAQMYDFINILSKFYFGAYDTVRPEGMPFFYAGMLMTILMPLFFICPGISPRKKVGGGFMMLLMLVSINLTTADLVWHGFQRPNWLNARFIFMFVFLMLVMAYEVFIRIDKLGYKKVVLSGGAAILVLIVLQTLDLTNLPDMRAIWPSIGIIGIYLAALRFTYKSAAKPYVNLGGILLASLVAVELFASGVVDLNAFDADVMYSTRESYRSFLDRYYSAVDYVDDDGFYREEKTDHRKTNDNLALGIRGLSNSTSTLNSEVIDMLSNFGLTSKSHWSKYVGGTLLTDTFFGIKYLYIDPLAGPVPDYVEDRYELLCETDDGILIYKNPYAFSIAFEVSDKISDFSYDPDSPKCSPFEYMNEIFALATGDEKLKIWQRQPLIYGNNEGNRKFGVQDNHLGYEKNSADGSATITYTFSVVDENPVYMYIPTKWPRKAYYTVTGERPGEVKEDGTVGAPIPVRYVNGKYYFTNDTHCIVELGSFTPGEKITVTFTQSEENFYVLSTQNLFYSYNAEAVDSIMNALADNQMKVTSFKEDKIIGKITADKNGTDILTTIPYDKGWHIVVDGKEISYKKGLDALITFEVDKGEHNVEMYYMSDSFRTGAIISVSGIVLFVLICVGDKFLVPVIKRRLGKAKGKLLSKITEKASAEESADVTDDIYPDSDGSIPDFDEIYESTQSEKGEEN